jgi:hypothetical protein
MLGYPSSISFFVRCQDSPNFASIHSKQQLRIVLSCCREITFLSVNPEALYDIVFSPHRSNDGDLDYSLRYALDLIFRHISVYFNDSLCKNVIFHKRLESSECNRLDLRSLNRHTHFCRRSHSRIDQSPLINNRDEILWRTVWPSEEATRDLRYCRIERAQIP